MNDAFDASPYVRPPILNVASAVGLSRALLAALPKDAPAAVRKAARKLRARARTLQDAWREAESLAKAEDPRPADQAIDGAWAALRARLDAWASLDAGAFPRATRAAELSAALFPDGLGFLALPYAEEWAESQRRLQRIDAEDLAKDLDALAGKDFLEAVRAAHARYGQAIGVTAARKGETRSLAEPLREASRAVVAYALQVVAAAQEADDEPTATRWLRALRPIDDHRADQARRAKSKGQAAEPTPDAPRPDTPIPDVPPAG